MNKSRSAKWQRRLIQPPRAVIDIGSNTVRMVIYEGTGRAPEVVWNEKVAARLGRDLSNSGRIPQEAWDEALAALARYSLIISDLGVEDVQTVATAAARDAENGGEFLQAVAKLGLTPRLLSGEEEACASAMGALGAFPGAKGVVADLGGGSLELVSIADNDCREASSLRLGTLRLPALRAEGPEAFESAVHEQLASVGWAAAHTGPMYMVGGTWRALAAYAMRYIDYPLTDPHGFSLLPDDARRLAKELVAADPEKLIDISGISPMRASYLPDAAALLSPLLDEIGPDELVFSSWGLREGLLYSRLEPGQMQADPLLAGVTAYAAPRDASITEATLLAAWTVDLADGDGTLNERLRLAAAQLSGALQRVEPNLRDSHAIEWSLGKRWIDLDARGRAMICAALFGSMGRTELPERLRVLASDDDLREGVTWGLGFRLARRLGGGSRMSLTTSALKRKKKSLVLRLDESRAALAIYPATRDFEILAEWLDLKPKIKIGSFAVSELSEEEE
ncbi:exopolyphosphatase [Erythrobacter sp. SAORIC-644]|uniref:Ppx/GppA family phosphatase n=1 Tax=Erythrobacter sp. SAORIC-644 TaxID=1869314 RepID=UPI000C9F9AEC|nr:Ppx/GppA family phosphatase [Erythrobacter sp. SAORIC-644]PNQ76720.1 exopolyphosphatase [Erythrobacter sp. SAORIC-644]